MPAAVGTLDNALVLPGTSAAASPSRLWGATIHPIPVMTAVLRGSTLE